MIHVRFIAGFLRIFISELFRRKRGVFLYPGWRILIPVLLISGLYSQALESVEKRTFFGEISTMDQSLSYRLQGTNRHVILDVTMESWTLGTPAVELGSSLFVFKNGDSQLSGQLVTALGTTGLIAVMAKYGVQRERPQRQYKPRIWNSRYTPSFPSGHTASFATYATFMSITYPETTPLMVGLTILTGYSQVYVGNHYVSDVVAGTILGIVVGSVFANQ